jgi:phage terminase large subunit-like protein
VERKIIITPISEGQRGFLCSTAPFVALIGGFGSGKTFAGTAKGIIHATHINKGLHGLVVLPTYRHIDRIALIEWHKQLKEYGIIPEYKPSKKELFLPEYGSTIWFGSADRPESLEGPEVAWASIDEGTLVPEKAITGGVWGAVTSRAREPGADLHQTWVTGTPRGRGVQWVKKLFYPCKSAAYEFYTGSSLDNIHTGEQYKENLKATFDGAAARILIDGKFEDMPEGALFNSRAIDLSRVSKVPQLDTVVVGVDPNASDNATSDEMGIIVAGKIRKDNRDGKQHYYVLDDYTCRGNVNQRIATVMAAYKKHDCDAIVVEINNGGDWIPGAIDLFCRAENIPTPIYATDPKSGSLGVRGKTNKQTRAQPVANLYDMGLVHHAGNLPELEDELVQWVPGDKSPNRLDANVWALLYLSGKLETPIGFSL